MYPNDLEARLREALDPDPQHQAEPGERLAAVLVPVLADGAVVFTKRSDQLSRHPGEISFPGGIRHDGDDGPVGTALRETEEELGVAPSEVDVLGALPPVHTFVSAILIVPLVGLLGARPVYRPNPGEISEVLEYPLDELVAAETEVEWRRGDGVYRGYAYEMRDHTIWGATAMILHDLLEIVRAGSRSGDAR